MYLKELFSYSCLVKMLVKYLETLEEGNFLWKGIFSGRAVHATGAPSVRQREFALYMNNLDVKCRMLQLSRNPSLSSSATH